MGITRSSVLSLAKEFYNVEEREIPVEELLTADEVFMTGTTKRVLPVNRIDDHLIYNGRTGPITQKLKSLYKDFENSFTILSNSGNQK